MLSLRPVRNPVISWDEPNAGGSGSEDEDAGRPAVVLTVPRRNDGLSGWLARRLMVPTGKRIELDEFGGAVWAKCDGAHTVEQLVRDTCENYKLNRRQGEISVVAFMRMLAQRKLVGFVQGEKGVSHGSPGPAGGAKPKRPKRTGASRRRN
jgi:hypothetical protein